MTEQAALEALCSAISADEPIGLDTEFARSSTYQPTLCLLQLIAGGRSWCIDTLADLDLGPLWALLCEGAGVRILHAAKQDLEVIYLTSGRLLPRLFDTQIAAALLGRPAQVGYAALVKEYFDIELDKTHTRADWSRRPLAPQLLDYALSDVVYLPGLHEQLRTELGGLGRVAWADEENERLLDEALYETRPEEAWQRLAPLAFMPVDAQQRGRRLAEWREVTARRVDRPRQWILSDRALLEIASRRPGSLEQLASIPELSAGFIRRQGRTVLELITEAEQQPMPAGMRRLERPEPTDQALVKRLSRVAAQIAGELGIAPELLATRRELTQLLRGERGIRPLQGWRAELVGDALLQALAAEQS